VVTPLCSHFHPQAGYPLWERSFDAGPINTWMEDNGWIPLTACAFYMAAIVAGKMLMANRPAFELRRPLAAWNLVSGARMRLTSRLACCPFWFGSAHSVNAVHRGHTSCWRRSPPWACCGRCRTRSRSSNSRASTTW
jgi:hypothetical protein